MFINPLENSLSDKSRKAKIIDAALNNLNTLEVELKEAAAGGGSTNVEFILLFAYDVSKSGRKAQQILVRSRNYVVQVRAALVAARHCDAQLLADSWSLLGDRIKRIMLKSLARRRKFELNDLVLERLLRTGETAHFLELLHLGSVEVLRAYLPKYGDCLTLTQWTSMANRHPEFVCAEVLRQLREAQKPCPHLLARVRVAVWCSSFQRFPDQCCELLQEALRHFSLKEFEEEKGIGRIRRIDQRVNVPPRCADRLARIYWEGVNDIPQRFMLSQKFVKSLSMDMILKILSRNEHLCSYVLKKALSPDKALALYKYNLQHWPGGRIFLNNSLLCSLPERERLEEARRRRLQACGSDDGLAFLEYLTYDEAIDEILQAMHHPDINVRLESYRALVAITSRQMDRLHETLRIICSRFKNEQADQRFEILNEVFCHKLLNKKGWDEEGYRLLAQILDVASIKLDLDHWFLASIGSHALTVLTKAPKVFAPLVRNCSGGSIPYQDVSKVTDPEDLRLIEETLIKVKPNFHCIEQYKGCIPFFPNLTKSLFKRAKSEIEASGNRGITAGLTWSAEGVMRLPRLVKRCDPDFFNNYCEELVAKDMTWLVSPAVFSAMSQKPGWNDLLNSYLSENYKKCGMFCAEGDIWLLPDLGHICNTFTLTQQTRYAEIITKVLLNKKDDQGELKGAWTRLSKLTLLPSQFFAKLLSDEPVGRKIALREMVLRKSDEEAIPFLIELQAAPIESALCRVCNYIPRKQVSRSILQGLVRDDKDNKTRKLMLHLLGRTQTSEARDCLKSIATSTSAEYRVQSAAIRALAFALTDQDIVDIFVDYTKSDPHNQLRKIIQLPLAGLHAQARSNLLNVFEHIIERHRVELRARTLHRIDQTSLEIFANNATDLLNKLAFVVTSKVDALEPEIRLAVRIILRSKTEGDADNILRDLLQSSSHNHKVVSIYISELYDLMDQKRNAPYPVLTSLQLVTEHVHLSVQFQVALVFLLPTGREIAQSLIELCSQNDSFMQEALLQIRDRVSSSSLFPEWYDVENALLETNDKSFGRMALEIFRVRTEQLGWTDSAQRRFLNIYRKHACLAVSSAAKFLFPEVREPPTVEIPSVA